MRPALLLDAWKATRPTSGGWPFAFLVVVFGAYVLSCAREPEGQVNPSPSPAPSLTAKPLVRSTAEPGATLGPGATPVPAASADEEEEEEDDNAAWGPEFEIDADASSYYGPAPNTVTFTAKALNGTPPFTFTWNFGDGSPPATGPTVTHTYSKLGRIDCFVIGRDANGDEYTVQLALALVTPEEYVRAMDLDPALLDRMGKPTPAAGDGPGSLPTPPRDPATSPQGQ